MMRIAFVMSVDPEKHREYQRRHSPIWPELEQVLTSHGVTSYSIFLDPASSQLFAYAEIESRALWEDIAKTEVCRKWWRYMSDLMPTNADFSPVAHELQEVFHIDQTGRDATDPPLAGDPS